MLAAVVSSHWSGQRGEFPVLHHSDGCVQLLYARAAGSPWLPGSRLKRAHPIGPGAPAKVHGSGPCPDTGLAPGHWVELVSSAAQTSDL